MTHRFLVPQSAVGAVLGVVVLALGTAAADDCHKAREVYARGVGLLNYEQRREAFQQAVTLCPSFAEARCNLADALENLAAISRDDVTEMNRLLDRAVSQYREALKYKPDLFAAHLGLGDVCRVMGMNEQAERAYRKALELKPDHPKPLAGLEKIRLIRSLDRGGFKTSTDIVSHVKTSSDKSEVGALMGFANHTVVKDRLRFDNILFNEWSAELTRGEATRQLEEIGKALASRDLSGCNFVVEGHTDNRGDLDRNIKLSWDRAESVKAHLVGNHRIDPVRIRTQGFGYSRPKFGNDTEENRLKNRRVEIMFLEGGDRQEGR
ncbi:MAG: tetratricopeptide repeat protein [Deltaproteobacteria bacterium]|nr:tetratricopeptide repeat protein [Deltaproteobacteria bacterium]